MCDLIRRQDAIDAHYEYCNKHPDAGFPVWSLKILEDLPSAQPETHDKRTETHSCDCIDRQAAIDALHGYFDGMIETDTWSPCDVYGLIKILPSAQLNSTESSLTQKALDTISRQAAIRWVKTECNPYGKPTLDFESGKKVIEHLERMPSAQPEHTSNNDCNGCKFVGCYDTDFPCANCIRKNKDYYATERRTDERSD